MLYMTSIRHHARTAEQAASLAAATYREASNRYRAALNVQDDPDLTPKGNYKRNAEQVASLIAKARTAAEELRAANSEALGYLHDTVEKRRPRIVGTEGLLAVGQAWDNVRSRLERGRSVRQVLANADATEALAVEKFAPDWMLSQGQQRSSLLIGDDADDTADIRPRIVREVTAHLAELSDPDTAELLRASLVAPGHVRAAEPWLRLLDHLHSAEQSQLAAAIESALIARETAAAETTTAASVHTP